MSDKMAAPNEANEGADSKTSQHFEQVSMPPWQRPYVTSINQLQIPVPLPQFSCLDATKEHVAAV